VTGPAQAIWIVFSPNMHMYEAVSCVIENPVTLRLIDYECKFRNMYSVANIDIHDTEYGSFIK
jgi:hypothetical protein